MSASIIQLLHKDRRDSFLTHNPNITYFKDNIKQHTPFAIDIIEEEFNKTPNFSDEVFCELSKYGDLVKSLMLKITLPSVHINNAIDNEYLPNYSQNTIEFDDKTLTVDDMISTYSTLITNFNEFMNSAMIYWRSIKLLLKNTNVNYNIVISHVNNFIKTQNDIQHKYDQYNEFTNVKIKNTKATFNFDLLTYITYNFTLYSNSVHNATLNTEYKNAVNKYLDNYIFSKNIYLHHLYLLQNKYIGIKNKHDSQYYRFAWVNNIALKIIDYVTLEIGGQQIDYHTSLSLDKWFKSASAIEHVDTINDLFGNIKILTSYDSEKKPKYDLYIPLPFGCLLHPGQSIPAVSTKYQDIIVKLKLAELYECCFFEPDEFSGYVSNINIDEVVNIDSASLLVEYVHLSKNERSKFVSKNLEMLVEQNRIFTFSSVQKKNVILPIDFSNAVKDIQWSIRKKYNVEQMKLWNNYDNLVTFPGYLSATRQQTPYIGYVYIEMYHDTYNNKIINPDDYIGGICEIYHSKYYNGKYKILLAYEQLFVIDTTEFIYPDNIKFILHRKDKQEENIIEKENINIYGVPLMSLRDTTYFKYVQDRKRNKSSSFHSYSIALNPEEFQPSGVLNFNVIKNKQLQLILTDNAIANNDSYIVFVLGKSYNTMNVDKGYVRLIYNL